ncbi:glucosyl-3-phosphoglycerate synthase [Clostridium aminobutyricum]|uniref:Glucosyl-3-phosphoglycerate synthase n=1 Tax=Clostridium aminobutyricum TaxID=33953 RepID=A0A939IJV3_CLOAM|nr:glucosyl-3-phosphoglycerate synthase [Clostridium aminobutyricum]MBN7773954.1 glucosyl-3-phosphoglycerate synthase [Clostridium aminobutyricum]
MNRNIKKQWEEKLLSYDVGDIDIIDVKNTAGIQRNNDSVTVITDGWGEGKAASILRGGSNAASVLKVMNQLGFKEITIFHIEEKIDHMEDVFITSVVQPAHLLFDKVSVIWRNDSNVFELLKYMNDEYDMVFLGAPLTVSEIDSFYAKVKGSFDGNIAIVRGICEDIDLDNTDDVHKWMYERTYTYSDFSFAMVLKELKRRLGKKIAVLLPSLNEEKTVGKVIETAKEVQEVGIIDEIILIDSDSIDKTVEIAKNAGIPFYIHQKIREDLGSYSGKGEAMYKSAYITDADILIWVDTDIESITPSFFYGLIGPMLTNKDIRFVKGFYERPVDVKSSGVELGGGRVTEIMMRPWINLYMPELSGFIQPLSGTVAIYKEDFLQMRIPINYGVEIAMLIQMLESKGIWSICQVNLGTVIHKSKDVIALSDMSFQILQTLQALVNEEPPNTTYRRVFTNDNNFMIVSKRHDITWRTFELEQKSV